MAKKVKRILALATVVLLAGMYIASLVFALIGSESAHRMLLASFFCTIFIPVVLYAMMMIAGIFGQKNDPSIPAEEEKE